MEDGTRASVNVVVEGVIWSQEDVEAFTGGMIESPPEANDSQPLQDGVNLDQPENEEADIGQEEDGSKMDASGTGNSQASGEEESSTPRRRRKKRKFSTDEGQKKNRKEGSAKKRKKRKSSTDAAEDGPPTELDTQDAYHPSSQSTSQITRATPGFFFYLTESRWKIERVLSKRSRAFSRLPKGHARNMQVAKEAAIWWSKLRPSDHKRYVTMSLRDFESRFIEWKEDKNIREMNAELGPVEIETEEDLKNFSDEDRRLTARKHKRLYISTSVGGKVFKPEKGQYYNRVLLDLLHDQRFHPLPMLGIDHAQDKERNDKEDPTSRVLIRHFDVHGPVSTSVGDECLGCLRGWVHYCPVLQRRLPALEPRAKLQPPMSSLLATRIGLGLRQPIFKKEYPPSHQQDSDDLLFVEQKSDDYKKLRDLPVLPSATLTDTGERLDDAAEFIQQTMAMRVPEPPRPDGDAVTDQASTTRERKEADSAEGALHKCGRCRAIVRGDTGCFQCRRAQLVINLAKRNRQDAGRILRVQTTMLGRLNVQERTDTQTPQDQAVASAILREKWMPCVVQAPKTTYVPDPHNVRESILESDTASSEASLDEECDSVESRESFDTPSSATSPVTSVQNTSPAESDRPVRSARLTPSYQETFDTGEKQTILEENRKQVNYFQKRLVTIACCGMLHALLRRDPLMLFASEVTVEGYLDVVKNPIDFSIIRKKLKSGGYSSVASFSADIKLLSENAILYNVPSSIYARTANEMLEILSQMQKHATDWITTLKDAYARHLAGDEARRRKMVARLEDLSSASSDMEEDPFAEIRREWPEAVEMFENEKWIKAQVFTDFTRTEENEVAYYGSLAVSRAAYAAEVSLAPYTDSKGIFNVVGMRSHMEDAAIRQRIDDHVSSYVGPPSLTVPSTWREESVHRLLRRLQSRRLDAKTASQQGCARCDGLIIGQDVEIVTKAEQAAGKAKRSEEHREIARVDRSRLNRTTGLASKNNRAIVEERKKQTEEEQFNSVDKACVSVRGSSIHGWGLYSDQDFAKGDVVGEYVGEYINNSEAEAREKKYREQRIQDYLFRVNDDLVIDATLKGGSGRYANHSCAPNCYTRYIPVEGKESLRRVMIIALRKIKVNEEITYDYQFPLEMDLDSRLPCNCHAESCRGFMNWDIPVGSVTPMLVQKRGANMRDRIRRLGRPLKRDEA
jgi:ferritin-like metal-binding protein YciE